MLCGPAALADEGPCATDSDPSTTHEGCAPGGRTFSIRAGAVGAYRSLYDLSILGAGASLSIGGGDKGREGYGGLRYVEARTSAGLTVREIGALGTVEWKWRDLRAGVGGGVVGVDVVRATNGNDIRSVGPSALVLVGYDFGRRPNVYFLADMELQIQAQALIWGPTVQLGMRF